MKVTLLGGGSEVGASCLHIEIDDTRLLIDAGMRMHHDDPMPAVGMLEELGGVDAILVTHAHADHIGALPFVSAMYPQVPIYATAPTIELMSIMMKDSYRILEARCQLEQRLPPYTKEQMLDMMNRVCVFPASGNLRVQDTEITLYRAGHILGAVMLGIAGGGERLLVTGDLSFRAGRTIPGAKVPYDFRPDVVVMESTYGNRAHVDRALEEKRLAEHVAEVVGGGGFALIPAFALGRSQEILLILQDAMKKGLIPEFPIYVDGMVTPICQIYRNYPQYLKGPVAYRIRQHQDVFLAEGRCMAVKDIAHREQLLKGKPGAIVASSGMLIGGASQWYAERLIHSERNAIFITGYQDEESPGRKLLALADSDEPRLELNGTVYNVACRVDKYALSAHADAMEMQRFIEQLGPAHTLLVHGDDEARAQLAQRLDKRFGPLLVENGVSYSFERRASGKGSIGRKYGYSPEQAAMEQWIGQILLVTLGDEQGDKRLFPMLCTGVYGKAAILSGQDLRNRRIIKVLAAQVAESLGHWPGAVQELEGRLPGLAKYNRPEQQAIRWELLEAGVSYTLAEACAQLQVDEVGRRMAAALALLALPEPYRHLASHPGGVALPRYTLDEDALHMLQHLSLPIQGLQADPATAMETARAALDGHPRFLRCGCEARADGAFSELVLYFDFPDALDVAERSRIQGELEASTGWQVKVSPSVRQDLLVEAVRDLLGGGIAGNPSIHREQRQLTIDIELPPNWEQVQQRFLALTGYTLIAKGAKGAKLSDEAAGGKVLMPSDSGLPQMEANRAQQEVKLWAREIATTVYKVGLRSEAGGGNRIELHFISPQIAVHYLAEMQALADRVGMPVTYAPNPKQNEIISIAKELIPAAWRVAKTPSIHIELAVVRIKPAADAVVEPTQWNEVAEKLLLLTGYRLEIG